jgi:hypothetical protein
MCGKKGTRHPIRRLDVKAWPVVRLPDEEPANKGQRVRRPAGKGEVLPRVGTVLLEVRLRDDSGITSITPVLTQSVKKLQALKKQMTPEVDGLKRQDAELANRIKTVESKIQKQLSQMRSSTTGSRSGSGDGATNNSMDQTIIDTQIQFYYSDLTVLRAQKAAGEPLLQEKTAQLGKCNEILDKLSTLDTAPIRVRLGMVVDGETFEVARIGPGHE